MKLSTYLWRTKLANGDCLSTVFLHVGVDEERLFETAVLTRRWHILEVYPTYEEAKAGHIKHLKNLSQAVTPFLNV